MDLYTFKDFYLKFGDCFNCHRQMKSNLITINAPGLNRQYSNKSFLPTISQGIMEIPIVNTYNTSLGLKINIENHNFVYSGNQDMSNGISKFLEDYKYYLFYLRLECLSCRSKIHTSTLEFDFKKQIVKPFSLSFELIKIIEGDKYYFLETSYFLKDTKVIIFNYEKHDTNMMYDYVPQDSMILSWREFSLFSKRPRINFENLSLLSIANFKNKQELVNKIETYTFYL